MARKHNSEEDPLKPVLVRAPESLWEMLDEHLKKVSRWQQPNRTAWIINAIVKQMEREEQDAKS